MIDLPPELPPMPTSHVVDGLIECGVNPDSVTTEEGELPELKKVNISEKSGVAETMFECIWKASWVHNVRFSNITLQAKYSEFTDKKYYSWQKGLAEQDLKRQGLLEKLPRVDNFPDNTKFLNALTRHRNIKKNPLLFEEPSKVWACDVEFVQQAALTEKGQQKITCFLGGLMVQDSDDPGKIIPFGFVGNEAYSNPNDD